MSKEYELYNEVKNWDFSYINYETENLTDWNLNDLILKHTNEDSRILDLGTAGGEKVIKYYPEVKEIVGTDYSEEMIKIMTDMFNNIENFLQEIIQEYGLNEEKIFETSLITNDNYKNKKGIFIFGNKKIYYQTLKFYIGLVGKIPPKYSILICNEETTLEELLAFLYLSVLCKFHSLFIILKPDKLELSLRITFQEKLES